MPGKKAQCSYCSKVMRSDNLKTHAITRDMYKTINNLLAQSLDSGISIDDKDIDIDAVAEEDSLNKKINETIDYLITHDKKELNDILEELEKEEELIDDVQDLKELVDVFVEDEFLETKPVMDKIKKRLVTLSSSKTISKSKLHRAEMLLREISQNRALVQDIIQRMNMVLEDAEEEEVTRMLKQLTREELLSEEQYLKLAKMAKELDLNKLISVIKDTMIGRGLDFLPRKTNDLTLFRGGLLGPPIPGGGVILPTPKKSMLRTTCGDAVGYGVRPTQIVTIGTKKSPP